MLLLWEFYWRQLIFMYRKNISLSLKSLFHPLNWQKKIGEKLCKISKQLCSSNTFESKKYNQFVFYKTESTMCNRAWSRPHKRLLDFLSNYIVSLQAHFLYICNYFFISISLLLPGCNSASRIDWEISLHSIVESPRIVCVSLWFNRTL